MERELFAFCCCCCVDDCSRCERDTLLLPVVPADSLSPSDSSELVFIANMAATAAFSVLIRDFSLFREFCDTFVFLLLYALVSTISSADTVAEKSVSLISSFTLAAAAAASASLPELMEASEGDRETVRETSPGPDSKVGGYAPLFGSNGSEFGGGGRGGGPYADATGYAGGPWLPLTR